MTKRDHVPTAYGHCRGCGGYKPIEAGQRCRPCWYAWIGPQLRLVGRGRVPR